MGWEQGFASVVHFVSISRESGSQGRHWFHLHWSRGLRWQNGLGLLVDRIAE